MIYYKKPVRITITFDEKSHSIFDNLKEQSKQSQSEIMRNALKFYSRKFKDSITKYGSIDLFLWRFWDE